MTLRTLIITAAILPLAACATSAPKVTSENSVNAKNAAVQHVPPTAEQKANTFIPQDGERRRLSRKRYREDKVKRPVSQGTN